MIPKDKAKELIDKFSNHCFDFEKYKEDNEYSAKQCALIAVNEIINILKETVYYKQETFNYWLEVKNEIEKL